MKNKTSRSFRLNMEVRLPSMECPWVTYIETRGTVCGDKSSQRQRSLFGWLNLFSTIDNITEINAAANLRLLRQARIQSIFLTVTFFEYRLPLWRGLLCALLPFRLL